jgi:hypothetical protein
MGSHPDAYVYYGVPLGSDDEWEPPWEDYDYDDWAAKNLPEGLAIGTAYGSEYPIYYLQVEELETRAWEGQSRLLDVKKMSETYPGWDEKFSWALKTLGRPGLTEQVGWYTCAYYG